MPLHFAFGPNGTLYADDEPYAAFDAHQQLWSVSRGDVSLLWQAPNRNPDQGRAAEPHATAVV